MSAQLAIIIAARRATWQKKLLPALFSLYAQHLLPAEFASSLGGTPLTEDAFRARRGAPDLPLHAAAAACAALTAQSWRGAIMSPASTARAKRSSTWRTACAKSPVLGWPRLFTSHSTAIFTDTRGAGQHGVGHLRRARRRLDARGNRETFGRDAHRPTGWPRTGAGVHRRADLRMDHYLGKEVLQNLLVCASPTGFSSRSGTAPTCATYASSEGGPRRRLAGGVLRRLWDCPDVMQNHLMQMLALTAMEPPAAFAAQAIGMKRCACCGPFRLCGRRIWRWASMPRRRAAPAAGRRTARSPACRPTHARRPTPPPCCAWENERWRGVPFFVECGKARRPLAHPPAVP